MSNMHESAYSQMGLSDLNVVKYLLINRSDIDKYYHEIQDNHFDNAGIVGSVNQELIALLSDLDEIMNKIQITSKQKEVFKLLEDGFTYSDIGKMTDRKRHTVLEVFNNLCERVVKENNKRWTEAMRGRIEYEKNKYIENS